MSLISDCVTIFNLLDPRKKPLQRFGAFLCRDRIAVLERERAAIENELVAVKDELRRVVREQEAGKASLLAAEGRLAIRDRFRRVPIGGSAVYALRRVAAAVGDPPRLVCPVCFERGDLCDLVRVRRAAPAIGGVQVGGKSYDLRCPNGSCRFRIGPIDAQDFDKAFHLAD